MPNLTLSHAATDILTLVLNMTLIDSDKNELTPIEINPNNSCYSWVEQSVERVN